MLVEIPVSHDSLFGSQLTNVIVEQAKRAKGWDKVVKAAENCGLKKVLTMVSQTASLAKGCFFSFLLGMRGAWGMRLSDSKKGCHWSGALKRRLDHWGGSSSKS